MNSSFFPDHVIFVRPDQRDPGPITRGQIREKAFAADGIWVGYCDITARDEPGEWHHHAEYDSVMYLTSGRCRIDHGSAGELSTMMSAGDFAFFGKGVIHRVQILGDGRCDYVFFRLGHGESVSVVEGPGPRVNIELLGNIDLSDWKGALYPKRVIHEGRYARLEPLDPMKHGDQLWDAVSGPESERLHRWLPDPTPTSRAEFEDWLVAKAALKDPLFYAVIDKATGRVEGRQSLMDINAEHGSAEIGHILWGPNVAQTRVTTEAFFLMADYVFQLGYRRWQWRCNSLNVPSRRAAARFGYRFEGIFRNTGVIKGRSRDNAWFSITDAEWPSLRAAFEAWLHPSNFNAEGQQRANLEAFKRVAR